MSDLKVKKGQIAHLDKDNSNNKFENLVFLCFDHHDQYDSSTSQSKNFTYDEVKQYREELYNEILPIIKKEKAQLHKEAVKNNNIESRNEKIKKILLEIIEDNYGQINNLTFLSSKAGLTRHTIAEYLNALSNENMIRIDREKTKFKKTYSLANSIENRIIDSFEKEIKKNETILYETRYIRRKKFEIDSFIETEKNVYIVEAQVAIKKINTQKIQRRVAYLTEASRYYSNINKTLIPVLLIAITPRTIGNRISTDNFDIKNIIIKYLEFEENEYHNFYKRFI